MAPKKRRILSKLLRLKLTDEIRELVSLLPTKNLRESHTENYVYYAIGEIKIGTKYYPVKIRIQLQSENCITVSVKSEKAGLSVVYPFNEPPVNRQAARKINEAVQNFWN